MTERHALVAAIAAVERLGAKHLIVSKRDRLARDPLVAILTERKLGEVGATLLAADGNNEQDPGSKLLRHILDGVAEFERCMIGIRTKAALAALSAQGKTLGRPMGKKDDPSKPRRQRSDKGKARGPQKHPNPSPRDRSLKWTRISAPTS